MKRLACGLMCFLCMLGSTGDVRATDVDMVSVLRQAKEAMYEDVNRTRWLCIKDQARHGNNTLEVVNINFTINKAVYNHRCDEQHAYETLEDISRYARNDSKIMEQLEDEVDRICDELNLEGDFYRANVATQLIQSLITYETDSDYTLKKFGKAQREYVKYPIQTLYEGKGDCEDSALVLYSLLTTMGYDCRFVVAVPSTGGTCHAGVLIKGNFGLEIDFSDPVPSYETVAVKVDGEVGETSTTQLAYNTTVEYEDENWYWIETTKSVANIGLSFNFNNYSTFCCYKFQYNCILLY